MSFKVKVIPEDPTNNGYMLNPLVVRPWSDIRADVSVKEHVFEGFLAQHGEPKRAGGGRDLLMKQTLGNYGGLIQRCPELGELQRRITEVIEGAGQ